MIRIADHVVADWGVVIWEHNGEVFRQIEACLFSGLILILDPEDFFAITDDEAW